MAIWKLISGSLYWESESERDRCNKNSPEGPIETVALALVAVTFVFTSIEEPSSSIIASSLLPVDSAGLNFLWGVASGKYTEH